MADSSFRPTYTPMKNPYSKTAVSFFRDDGKRAWCNCCWCGAIIHGLGTDAKLYMNEAVKRYCTQCGKLNTIQFHWSLTVEATPVKE